MWQQFGDQPQTTRDGSGTRLARENHGYFPASAGCHRATNLYLVFLRPVGKHEERNDREPLEADHDSVRARGAVRGSAAAGHRPHRPKKRPKFPELSPMNGLPKPVSTRKRSCETWRFTHLSGGSCIAAKHSGNRISLRQTNLAALGLLRRLRREKRSGKPLP